MSNICITAFKWVPPLAQGLVRDLRVRWALEEAGLAYTEKLLGPGEQNSPAHRAVQPQVAHHGRHEGAVVQRSGPVHR